jgi:hypothetical protein
VKGLVGQGPRTTRPIPTRSTGQSDVAEGDADIALSGANDARAVRSEQAHVGKVAHESGCR